MAAGIKTDTTTVSALDSVDVATPVTMALGARTPPISTAFPGVEEVAAAEPSEAPPVRVAADPVRITSTVSPTPTPSAGS
jgi:hypothetical protein